MNILIAGGSGGIGLAMVKEVVRRYPQATVHATYRTQQPNELNDAALINRVCWHQVDITQPEHVKVFSCQLSHLDWLINCVGMLHTSDKGPEKNVASLDAEFFLQNMTVNTLPSLLLAKHFTSKLKQSTGPRFATVSAKVGSISDNYLGGWYSYRSSKAALNMFLKTLSIEWQRTVKHGAVLALHPGTTDTALSKPFQANVPEGKLFNPDFVAKNLLDLIENSTAQDNGKFWAYDGECLLW